MPARGNAGNTVVEAQWDIALRDLNFVLKLDDDGDGSITWGEVRKHQADIARYAYANLRASGDGAPCTVEPSRQLVTDHPDGAYAALFFRIVCKGAPRQLALDYRLFFAVDPSHRGILVFRAGGRTATSLASPETRASRSHCHPDTFQRGPMERITMSMDEALARDFDQLIHDRGYTSRSEAMRDLLRREIEAHREARDARSQCVANLSYVFNHHERKLSERLMDAQHQHHDLVVSTMHVHLDHEHCLESVVLQGPALAVRAFADRTQAERGVRHGQLNLVTVQASDTHFRLARTSIPGTCTSFRAVDRSHARIASSIVSG